MKKIFPILAWITILAALGLMFLFFYWLFYPYKVIQFQELPHQILNENKTVKAGDHVSYDLNYCKNIEVGAEMTISFVDGFIYNTTPIPTNLEVGCHELTQQVYVPKAIPVGIYSIKTVYRYKVNPVRDIDVITTTEKFTVVK